MIDTKRLLARADATRKAALRSYFDAMTMARKIEQEIAPDKDSNIMPTPGGKILAFPGESP